MTVVLVGAWSARWPWYGARSVDESIRKQVKTLMAVTRDNTLSWRQ